jgi:hypothetical protein
MSFVIPVFHVHLWKVVVARLWSVGGCGLLESSSSELASAGASNWIELLEQRHAYLVSFPFELLSLHLPAILTSWVKTLWYIFPLSGATGSFQMSLWLKESWSLWVCIRTTLWDTLLSYHYFSSPGHFMRRWRWDSAVIPLTILNVNSEQQFSLSFDSPQSMSTHLSWWILILYELPILWNSSIAA